MQETKDSRLQAAVPGPTVSAPRLTTAHSKAKAGGRSNDVPVQEPPVSTTWRFRRRRRRRALRHSRQDTTAPPQPTNDTARTTVMSASESDNVHQALQELVAQEMLAEQLAAEIAAVPPPFDDIAVLKALLDRVTTDLPSTAKCASAFALVHHRQHLVQQLQFLMHQGLSVCARWAARCKPLIAAARTRLAPILMKLLMAVASCPKDSALLSEAQRASTECLALPLWTDLSVLLGAVTTDCFSHTRAIPRLTQVYCLFRAVAVLTAWKPLPPMTVRVEDEKQVDSFSDLVSRLEAERVFPLRQFLIVFPSYKHGLLSGPQVVDLSRACALLAVRDAHKLYGSAGYAITYHRLTPHCSMTWTICVRRECYNAGGAKRCTHRPLNVHILPALVDATELHQFHEVFEYRTLLRTQPLTGVSRASSVAPGKEETASPALLHIALRLLSGSSSSSSAVFAVSAVRLKTAGAFGGRGGGGWTPLLDHMRVFCRLQTTEGGGGGITLTLGGSDKTFTAQKHAQLSTVLHSLVQE